MKKLLFAAFALTLALSMTAQDHMKFKGLEITGPLSDFGKQLTSQGFTYAISQNNGDVYYGKFTGQDVLLALCSTPVSHTLYSVIVLYPGQSLWPSLKEQYMTMKELLNAKYGDPSEVTEQFEGGYSEDFEPLVAFAQEKAIYRTRYKTENGGITLSIARTNGVNGVVVNYWDEQGYKLNEQEVMEDL